MSMEHRGIGMTSLRTRERLINRLMNEGITDPAVLETIRSTPRHLFVDEALASRAYEDTALPIGYGQTISQPYVVARMTEALMRGPKPKKVLEVGTGSGYQTAVLAQLVDEVFTVERIKGLMDLARKRFRSLNLYNIRMKYSDGSWGWTEHAPFDGIIVTASPLEVPQALLEQLNIGGRLVIPVGQRGMQELIVVTHARDGYTQEVLDHVKFVSLLTGRE
jgi:protein-L-isoaspartate(D-aspartate) O-methyltransferase